MLEVRRRRISWDHVGRRLGHVVTHVSLQVQSWSKPVSDRRRSSHGKIDHGHMAGVQMMTILHDWIIPIISSLLTPGIILLLFLDLVSLVRLTPRVVSGRPASVDHVVLHPRSVLSGPEHREVRLERLQELVHHVAAGRSVSSTERVVLELVTSRQRVSSASLTVSGARPRP